MPTAQKASKPSKKEVRHQIAQKLETALASFKIGMGEKKFKSRIKKASKLFSEHYADAIPASKKVTVKKSSTPSTKVTATKSAVKKTAPRKKAAEAVKL